ncbi:hypothetical protein Zm00014a_007962 [Zea mays]|uniref:Agenet domain-containing protein n=1 Tax=Zea mays TaxID=4577 RepID=A0A3L6DHD1_MAIZE|nr:hypothetical protein Zm00014a_007962 [Zea mays]PWZ08017.1 hypothetical protein Zm00014a_007962 [Zea mays]PWZ08018.1 hypothetical protein Zm00014a_007962 [Zea mays]PWZ08019.1 hypothetical protein Zm00014a_007962 [Zea mays]
MRFFKGSKVEVLQEAEVPFGSWRPGEIISGNGHTYLVRYDESPVDSSVAVERMPRRLIRPSPPTDDPVRWSLGSILEAFDSYSWKVAEVVRVLKKNQYLVRLLGSSLELSAHASDLRLRKLWLDDRWIVTQKGQGWRLVKHPSIGSYKWRSLPHVLQCDKCGNISIELLLVKQGQECGSRLVLVAG